MMNDPHVDKLHYKIEHASSVDYSAAETLEQSEKDFDVRVEAEKVCFTMKRHCATEREACEVVRDYIDAWELNALLVRGPGAFSLRFDYSEIHDRNPTPGVVSVAAKPIRLVFSVSEATVTVAPRFFPEPPLQPLKITTEVEAMLQRFREYRLGRRNLGEMAYFCLTVLVSHRTRSEAANHFGISKRVLNKIGLLSSEAGGDQARKASGMTHDWSQEERQFLEAALTLMIRRFAEKAYDPHGSLPKIGINDLPAL